jgi:hypothetical protein
VAEKKRTTRARAQKGAGRRGAKVDLFRERPEYFTGRPEPELIRLRPVRYLAIEGAGSPESPAFQQAIGGLYGVAYTLKFERQAAGRDFKVCTLEGLWWASSGGRERSDAAAMATARPADWRWKLLIMVPDFVRAADVARAKKQLAAKRGDANAARVRLERVNEGLCIQALHVGSYATEPATIAKMQNLWEARKLAPAGFHHEIYLSDPRRTKPEKNRTLLRQAVKKARGAKARAGG